MTNELTHYGIKGMKWGVRRAPTQSGKHKTKRLSRRQLVAENQKKRAAAASAAKRMSDEQLKKVINRAELERKYTDIVGGREEKMGRNAALVALGGIGSMLLSRAAGKAFDKFVWDPLVERRGGSRR